MSALITNNAPNLFLNSTFWARQRFDGGFTSLPASFEYFFDRWKSQAIDTSAAQINQSSMPASFPGEAFLQNELCMRVSGNANNSNALVDHTQQIEHIRFFNLSGQKFSSRFYVWASNFQEMRVTWFFPDTENGTSIGSNGFNERVFALNDSDWTEIVIEDEDIPNEQGCWFQIRFRNPSNPTGAFDTYVQQAQFNVGAKVTDYKAFMPDQSQEQWELKRYFQKSWAFDIAPGPASSTSQGARFVQQDATNGTSARVYIGHNGVFEREMRANPGFVIYNHRGNFLANRISRYNANDNATLTQNQVSANRKGFQGYVETSLGALATTWGYHFTVDAEL